MTTKLWTALHVQFNEANDGHEQYALFDNAADMFEYLDGIAPRLREVLAQKGITWDNQNITYDIDGLKEILTQWDPMNERMMVGTNEDDEDIITSFCELYGIHQTDDGLDEQFINPHGVLSILVDLH